MTETPIKRQKLGRPWLSRKQKGNFKKISTFKKFNTWIFYDLFS